MMFVNGEYTDVFGSRNISAISGVTDRYLDGYTFAKENYADIISGYEAALAEDPSAQLDVVTHSQGAAFGEGMAGYIAEQGDYTVNRMIHLQPGGAYFLRIHIDYKQNTTHSVQTRIGFYTMEDPVVNKYGGRLNGIADIEIEEYRMVVRSFFSSRKEDRDINNSRMDIDVRRNGSSPHLSTTLEFGQSYKYDCFNAHGTRAAGKTRAEAISKAIRTGLRNK
jgi:hypothetical protein